MVDSSQAEDRRMIQLVRQRPLLYIRSNIPVASYYTQVKKLWQEIAKEMNWTVAEVRRKWSHVRNSYSRHLRNELNGATTGKGRAVSKWYLADELTFLREHMATDIRYSPYSSRSPRALPDTELSTFHSTWLKTEDHQASYSDDNSNFTVDENNSYFQFFRGIHGDYKDLSPRLQRTFKRHCLEILHQLLDKEEQETMPVNLSQNTSSHLNYDSSSEDRKGSFPLLIENVISESQD